MAKDKQRPAKGMVNRHLHARTTFLYQAAAYLTLQAAPVEQGKIEDSPTHSSRFAASGDAVRLGTHLRSISMKGQLHLSQTVKRTICKSCSAMLIPGRTANHVVENLSKGGRKPWADVLVVECRTCGSKKRFPVGASRQESKSRRASAKTTPLPVEASPDTDLFVLAKPSEKPVGHTSLPT
ncbi:Rpr2-domain-containing protein [Sporormia fimetaria CBS 119925]|uniref:Rpr2-domain-containing protein n=1 Tax=Sporormia fimetaria CBS 119925 TaxID=1340428 RepID=A0A6A6VG21_9PLEO|nr:Rpr2-domain-containing protein [Sporormia fimetaria CBS 119925]